MYYWNLFFCELLPHAFDRDIPKEVEVSLQVRTQSLKALLLTLELCVCLQTSLPSSQHMGWQKGRGMPPVQESLLPSPDFWMSLSFQLTQLQGWIRLLECQERLERVWESVSTQDVGRTSSLSLLRADLSFFFFFLFWTSLSLFFNFPCIGSQVGCTAAAAETLTPQFPLGAASSLFHATCSSLGSVGSLTISSNLGEGHPPSKSWFSLLPTSQPHRLPLF